MFVAHVCLSFIEGAKRYYSNISRRRPQPPHLYQRCRGRPRHPRMQRGDPLWASDQRDRTAAGQWAGQSQEQRLFGGGTSRWAGDAQREDQRISGEVNLQDDRSRAEHGAQGVSQKGLAPSFFQIKSDHLASVGELNWFWFQWCFPCFACAGLRAAAGGNDCACPGGQREGEEEAPVWRCWGGVQLPRLLQGRRPWRWHETRERHTARQHQPWFSVSCVPTSA